MEIELRPLNLGEILDRTFQLYRARFLTFIGIASLGAGIDLFWRTAQVLSLRFLLAGHVSPLALSLVTGLTGVIAGTIFAMALALVLAATNCAVILFYLGRPPGIAQSYSEVWPRWFRYIRLNALMLLVCAGPSIVPFLAFVGSTSIASYTKHLALIGIGVSSLLLVATFPLCVWLVLRYSLANAVCTFEDASIRQSMKRSVFLSFGMRWQILVLLLLVFAAQMILATIFVAPVIPLLLASHAHPPLGLAMYLIAVGFMNNLLIIPIVGIGLMVFYLDARIRKEGFDVEWMLERSMQAGMPPSSEPESSSSGAPVSGSGDQGSSGLGLA